MWSHYFIKDCYYKYVKGSFPLPRHCFYKEINGREVIFIHIPKTAGTSITRAMKMPPPNPSWGVEKHVSIDEAFDIAGAEVWQNALKFTCVRNPWDRLFSHYNFKRSHDILPARHRGLSFNEWGKVILNSRMLRMERPQSDWITPTRGQDGVNRVMRFEDLTTDIKELGEELGIKLTLPHLLKAKDTGDYREAYDNELMDLVGQKFEKDIEKFGYSF